MLPGLCPIGILACSSLAQNPEHWADASASSRMVSWSGRPLAAVYVEVETPTLEPLNEAVLRLAIPSGHKIRRANSNYQEGLWMPTTLPSCFISF